MLSSLLTIIFLVLATYGTTNVKFPNGKMLKVELAMTAEELAKGMAGRKSIPEEGMLLVYKAPTRTKYHLLTYPGPVDILYLDENKKVINLKRDAAPCRVVTADCGHDSTWEHIYSLQLPPGTLTRLNIKGGEVLSFEIPETPAF